MAYFRWRLWFRWNRINKKHKERRTCSFGSPFPVPIRLLLIPCPPASCFFMQGRFFHCGSAAGFAPEHRLFPGKAQHRFSGHWNFSFAFLKLSIKYLFIDENAGFARLFGVKKDPARLALARSIFLLWFYKWVLPQITGENTLICFW